MRIGAIGLFLFGFVVATGLWLGLVWIPRRLAPLHALERFAAERGHLLLGDGLSRPASMVGQVRGRAFTITWQRHWAGGDVLLVGVDCAAATEGEVDADTAGSAATIAGDAALVTRWVRPAPELFEPGRLATLLDSLATMAEELEANDPADASDPEHG